jgi:hypothetical protein
MNSDRRAFLKAAATVGTTTAFGGSLATAAARLDRRKLGKLEVSCIGLGCMQMAGPIYGVQVERKDMIALARSAVDLGVTFFDTAEAYGPFTSEDILGEALQGVRDKVVIATKFGFDIDPETGQRRGGTNSQPEQIRKAVGWHAEAPAHSPHRSALPASRRSQSSHRRRGRHGA